MLLFIFVVAVIARGIHKITAENFDEITGVGVTALHGDFVNGDAFVRKQAQDSQR